MQKRKVYIDLLKILAILAVIMLHIAAIDWLAVDIETKAWNVMNFFNSLVRWCVPVFIMVSGVSFLDEYKEVTIKKLYTKYILRILVALILYGFFYNIFNEFLCGKIINLEVIKVSVINVFKGITNYHLWFLYVVIGLYILTPVVRIIAKNSKREELEYFLLISFIFTSIIPTLNNLNILKEYLSFFNNMELGFLMNYFVYYILGYYLENYNLKKLIRNIIYLLSLISIFGTMYLTKEISIQTGTANEIFYNYLTPNVFITSAGIFIFVKEFIKNINLKARNKKIITSLSKITFTVYLIHDAVFRFLEKKYFIFLKLDISDLIILKFLIVTIVSFIIAYMFKIVIEAITKIFKKNGKH